MTIIKYITTAEAAEKLGVSQRYVSTLIKEGRIKAIPLGRALRGNGAQPAAWMIEEKEIETFAAIPRRPPGRPAGSKSKAKKSKPKKSARVKRIEKLGVTVAVTKADQDYLHEEKMGHIDLRAPSYQERMAARRRA